MSRTYRIITGLMLAALLAVPNAALATTTFSLNEVSSGISGYDRTYDIMVTTDGTLGTMEMILDTLVSGSIYQNFDTGPDDPYEDFASYVTFNSSIGAAPLATSIIGGAVDLGGAATAVWTDQNINISWGPEGGQTFSNGTFHIGRITLADLAGATYSITGFEGLGVPATTLQGVISAPALILSMVEVGGAPAGYKTYDFSTNINTSMGAMGLMLETYHPGDIYQNSLLDAPNVGAEPFDTYVTIGASGPNPSSTQILGGAVDIGGSATVTFSNDSLDIAWAPTSGTTTGPGQRQIARVTVHEKAQFTYTLMGWETGVNDDVPVTISGVADSPVTIEIVEVTDAGTPAGYVTYDFKADISTDMGAMELILDTDTLGDIYQNNTGDDPNVAVEAYDTYVTIGAGPNPSSTQILGGAGDLGGSALDFDTKNIDIAWLPSSGTDTGRGLFQISRITLKDTATGSWTLGGWQAGANDDVPVILSGTIVDGVIRFLSGDVNGDGLIDGTDLDIVIANWGKTGLGWFGGDLNENNVVDGPDYAEVLSFWAPAEPPEALGGVPEPASIGLLLTGMILLARRRRRSSKRPYSPVDVESEKKGAWLMS